MELTLDQALKNGIEAHKTGKVQEADRYYTTILIAQPKHSHANHNMGVLSIGAGKIQEALPFFKIAIETNSSIAQFWLSYIDALIKLNRINDAKAVLNQAKNKDLKGDGFKQLEKRLGSYSEYKNDNKDPQEYQINILDKINLYQALKLAQKNLKDGLGKEAIGIYKDILKRFPKNKKAIDGIKAISERSQVDDPPQDQLQSIINLYTQLRFKKCLTEAWDLLKEFPNSANLYNLIGAVNKDLSKSSEALEAFNKALSIKPDYFKAHNNMGVALKDQGKLEEAIEAYKKAL